MGEKKDIISSIHARIGNPMLASLFMYLIYIADENGVVTQSYAEIGKAFKMSKQLVARNINLLRRFDTLLTDSYPITILNIVHYRGFSHTLLTERLLTVDKKNRTEGEKKEKKPLTNDPEMNKVIEQWLAYKSEKRQTYKPIGLKTLVSRLLKLSNNDAGIAKRIVEQSIMNNYSGLFPLKTPNAPSRQDEQEKVANILKDFL